MDNGELVGGVAANGVAVMKGRRAMCGPMGVGNRDLAEEGLGLVDVGFRKVLAQSHDFANLLEEQYLAGSIAINAYAGAGVCTPWCVSIEREMCRWRRRQRVASGSGGDKQEASSGSSGVVWLWVACGGGAGVRTPWCVSVERETRVSHDGGGMMVWCDRDVLAVGLHVWVGCRAVGTWA